MGFLKIPRVRFGPKRFYMDVSKNRGTLPETNIAPENGWLEYYFPFGKAYFQGLC